MGLRLRRGLRHRRSGELFRMPLPSLQLRAAILRLKEVSALRMKTVSALGLKAAPTLGLKEASALRLKAARLWEVQAQESLFPRARARHKPREWRCLRLLELKLPAPRARALRRHPVQAV